MYDKGTPIVSDKEWDDKYFKLQQLEKETGIIYPFSPTQSIYYASLNKLNTVVHNHKMLSLYKTKEISELESFFKDKEYVAMAKMDGLTCSLRYFKGKLISAETRGNGEVGEDIYHNALVIKNIPQEIPYLGELIVDGEIICTYNDFEAFKNEYKNPRNFASGSIRLLDNSECAKRNLSFIAWDVIVGLNEFIEYEEYPCMDKKLLELNRYGFTVVPLTSGKGNFEEVIEEIKTNCSDYPIDGIVFKFRNTDYYESLGATAHHPLGGIAYKFYDEIYDSMLKDIEWTMGRTGVLTPVAIFKTVDMDGSEVNRASLHNISIMKEIFHGIPFKDQAIQVYKANMIIPQVYSAEEISSNFTHYPYLPFIDIPEVCPVCGGVVKEICEFNTCVLKCIEPTCSGKLVNKLEHFLGKKGLDAKGISKATLEKLVDWGWVETFDDVFNLHNHREEWIAKPGFGQKSVDNILNSILSARNTTFEKFLSAIGIPLVGQTVAKDLTKHFKTYEEFREKVKNKFDFSSLEGFAESKTEYILNFDYTIADNLYANYITISTPTVEEIIETEDTGKVLSGKSVVITGRLTTVKNRGELQNMIERAGGKVVGSVSKNTYCLVNNDIESASAKNKTAKSLNIPILTEKEFMQKFFDK